MARATEIRFRSAAHTVTRERRSPTISKAGSRAKRSPAPWIWQSTARRSSPRGRTGRERLAQGSREGSSFIAAAKPAGVDFAIACGVAQQDRLFRGDDFQHTLALV